MSFRSLCLGICLLPVACCLLPLSPCAAALLEHGLRVEGERMLRTGMWRMTGMFMIESGAKPGIEEVLNQPVEVDAVRMPVSMRYGFSPKLEFGADIMLEQNKGLDLGVAKVFNQSGLAYIDLVAKHKLLPWSTLVGRIGVLGDDQLYNGGGDGLDFGLDVLLTLPLNLPIGMPNLIHFNAGARFKSGEPDIDADNRRDPINYTDPIYLAWSLAVSPQPRWSVIGEIFAKRSPFGLEEEVELALGTRYAYTERTTLMLSLSHGVSDGSSDLALRFGMQSTFGSLTERQIARQVKPKAAPAEIKLDAEPPPEISVTRLTTIADAAYARGDYVAAADAFAELASRLPSDGRIYFNLGVCYYNMKDYKRSEGDFLKAMSLMPDDPEVHLYIGHCQFMQGRPIEAKRHWEETLRLDPANELAKFLLSSIQ